MVPATLEQPVAAPSAACPGVGRSGTTVVPRGLHGPARDEVLARLRDRSGRRPRVDPDLAGGLRAWLEDGAGALSAARGDDAPPLHLGPRLLLAQTVPPDASPDASRDGADPYPPPLVTSCLVHALFRQLVTSGAIGDPLADALDALRVQPGRGGLVDHVDDLSDQARGALAAELRIHAGHLRDLTPRLAPGWLPRTDDRVSIPLAGGRVVLCGLFDLLVGAPVAGQASVCAVALTSGGPRAFARTALHYLALLETLRNGSPPFRLALLDSGAGRYAVEDVQEGHLSAMVSHVVMRLSGLAQAHRAD